MRVHLVITLDTAFADSIPATTTTSKYIAGKKSANITANNASKIIVAPLGIFNAEAIPPIVMNAKNINISVLPDKELINIPCQSSGSKNVINLSP